MVLKACIIPVLLYGSELWGMNVSLSRKHETLVNTALRWVLGTSGAGVSTQCMRLEFNVPGIAESAAARRAGAFKTWESKKTWISDLIKNPIVSRKATWTSGSERWLKKFDSQSPVKDTPSSSATTPVLEPKGRFKKSVRWLAGNTAASAVRKRTEARDTTKQLAWYKKHFDCDVSFRKWQQVWTELPERSNEFTTLAKARLGALPTAVNLATWGKIDPRFKHVCPFCDLDGEESDCSVEEGLDGPESEEEDDALAHATMFCERKDGSSLFDPFLDGESSEDSLDGEISNNESSDVVGQPEDLAHWVLECPRWNSLRKLCCIGIITWRSVPQ
jgi:hypothetical protein